MELDRGVYEPGNHPSGFNPAKPLIPLAAPRKPRALKHYNYTPMDAENMTDWANLVSRLDAMTYDLWVVDNFETEFIGTVTVRADD